MTWSARAAAVTFVGLALTVEWSGIDDWGAWKTTSASGSRHLSGVSFAVSVTVSATVSVTVKVVFPLASVVVGRGAGHGAVVDDGG